MDGYSLELTRGLEFKTTVVPLTRDLTRDLTRGDSKNEGPRDPNPPKRNATMNRTKR